jgi:hypothetical protein
MDKDITKDCEYYDNDGDCLPLLKCACGETFDAWDFILSTERDRPHACRCGRRLYFTNAITIYEILE